MSGGVEVRVREAQVADRAWIMDHLTRQWGSTTIISRGRSHDALQLRACVAVQEESFVGLATFDVVGEDCELVTLDAFRPRGGVGSALLEGVAQRAKELGCSRLWLITTNDNVDAVRFYQRRGFRLSAVHRGAVDDARRIKPSIPSTGEYGIAIHDELEFELALGDNIHGA